MHFTKTCKILNEIIQKEQVTAMCGQRNGSAGNGKCELGF